MVFFSFIFFYLFAGYLLTSYYFYQPSFALQNRDFFEEKLRNCEIVEPIFVRAKSVKAVVQIEDQKGILYFQKDTHSIQLKPGDIIQIQSSLKRIDPPKNPEVFNYRLYMQRRGILLTAYISGEKWRYVGKNEIQRLKNRAYTIQQSLTQILKENGLTGSEYHVATAILLGDDDTMEPELKAEYSNAGVSHILSVSGMHVGIIFMILNYILMPLDWNKKTRYLKTGILLITIWIYAAITGLSPSVIRSATMFTFVLLGAVLHRKTNIFQSLYASLFILLIINPLLIFDVGFQLSYLAVFGIVFFQKPIESLYQPKTKMGNYVWSLCSVSIAAQLSTFPISIFYFHQFPNYFLLANLMVIFLSFCIMVCGIAVLAVSFIPLICTLLAKLLQLLISWMNQIIEFIQQLPGAVTENLSVSKSQMLMLYLCILLFFITFKNKNKRALIAGLLTFLIFWISNSYDLYQSKRKSESIVFAASKNHVLLFRDRGNGIILSDSIAEKASPIYRFSIQNYMIKEKINPHFLNFNQDTIIGDFYKKRDLVLFKNKKILLLTSNTNIASYSKISFDYVYLVDPKINVVTILNGVHCKKIIWGEEIPIYLEKQWIEWCKKNKISYHSTREKGAFIEVKR